MDVLCEALRSKYFCFSYSFGVILRMRTLQKVPCCITGLRPLMLNILFKGLCILRTYIIVTGLSEGSGVRAAKYLSYLNCRNISISEEDPPTPPPPCNSGIIGIEEEPNIILTIPYSHYYRMGGPPKVSLRTWSSTML